MKKLICIVAIFILFGATTATAGHWVDWKEEALLHDGQVLIVERSLYFEFELVCGDTGGLGTFCNIPTTHKISFKHPDTQKKISWKEDFKPVALEIIDKVPYLVAYGSTAEVKMGKYPVCNGIPYLFYRHNSSKSLWELLAESEIPKELTKANLGFHYEKENKGKLRSHKEIVRANAILFEFSNDRNLPKNFHEWTYNSNDKWNFAASQRRMYKGKDGCKEIKPLPDSEMAESRKISQVLEDSAKTVVGVFIGIEKTPETFTEEQYKAIHGVWVGVTWLKPSCKGIVDKVEELRDMNGPYARQITFSNGKRVQFNKNHWFTMTTCSRDMVFAIRRKDYTNYIITRYRSTGEIIDVTNVAMEENKMPHTKEWQELLRVQPVSSDELIFEFAQLEGYETPVPPPYHRIAVWKAKFRVKLMATGNSNASKNGP